MLSYYMFCSDRRSVCGYWRRLDGILLSCWCRCLGIWKVTDIYCKYSL